MLSSVLLKHYLILPEAHQGEPQQVGWDITVKDLNQVFGGRLPRHKSIQDYKRDTKPVEWVRQGDQESAMLYAGVYSVTFDQGCDLRATPHVHAEIRHRSSLARLGGIITSGVYDPGFYCDNMGAMLHVPTGFIVIERHARIAQFVADHVTGIPPMYDGQYQGEKDIK